MVDRAFRLAGAFPGDVEIRRLGITRVHVVERCAADRLMRLASATTSRSRKLNLDTFPHSPIKDEDHVTRRFNASSARAEMAPG